MDLPAPPRLGVVSNHCGNERSQQMNAWFSIERETKGAVRYFETDERGERSDSPKVGTLYLRKDAIRRSGYVGAWPTKVSIAVTLGG